MANTRNPSTWEDKANSGVQGHPCLRSELQDSEVRPCLKTNVVKVPANTRQETGPQGAGFRKRRLRGAERDGAALGRRSQVDLCEPEARLVYTVVPGPPEQCRKTLSQRNQGEGGRGGRGVR